MTYDEPIPNSPLARWSRTLAVFSVQVVLVAIVLHRLLSLPTPVALNVLVLGLAGALLAVLLALGAYVAIWRDGRMGALSASIGLLLGLALLGWPAALVPIYRSMPPIHDISTDMAVPPAFVALAPQRAAAGNGPAYGGTAIARQQQEAYPDIRPVIVPRPVSETWELVGETVKRLKWKVAAEQPPGGRGKPGYIEAVDRTLILGFYDDVVVRVDGDARETRIDVRSASRFGEHDLGRNAARIRKLFKELKVRLDETVTGSDRPRRRRGGVEKVVPKRGKGQPLALQGQKAKAGVKGSKQAGQQPKRPNRRQQQE
ncbi:MAG: DUF1499 domain-containing protein [Hyphomicrobiaceae bacterium]